jgi:hypothetical protein
MSGAAEARPASEGASAGDDAPRSLSGVIDELRGELEGDEVSVEDIMDAFAGRLFGPVIVLPALFALTPLGAIPLVPTAIGVILLLFAVQRALGRDHPWIPRFLREKTVSHEKLDSALERFEPWARRIDKVVKPRLSALVEGPMERVVAVVVVGLALSMPPLELVPFAVFVPASGALLLGVALTARDGLLAGLGMAAAAGTIGALMMMIV